MIHPDCREPLPADRRAPTGAVREFGELRRVWSTLPDLCERGEGSTCRGITQLQDLTRISNRDCADVRGLAPRAVRLHRTAGLSSLCCSFEQPRDTDQSVPRSFILDLGSWRAETSSARSDPADPSHRCIPFPFVCGASPLRPASTTEGGFGCMGIGRISPDCFRNS